MLDSSLSLNAALLQVCEALHAQAEPRGILIAFQASEDVGWLDDRSVMTLALVVNELATNAIKHAFIDGGPGVVRVQVRADGNK